MSNVVGTPDWQRGTVSPGKLIATVPPGTLTTTVSIPANAQAIAVASQPGLNLGDVIVRGVQSGIYYQGAGVIVDVNTLSAIQIFPLPLTGLDTSLDVSVLSSTAPSPWYVYALSQSGALWVMGIDRMVMEAGNPIPYYGVPTLVSDGSNMLFPLVDGNGRQISLVPTVGHSQTVAAGTTQLLVPAFGTGDYLFSIDVINTSGVANTLTFTDASGNTIGIVALAVADPTFTTELQGFRITTALSVTATAAATIVVRYAPGP